MTGIGTDRSDYGHLAIRSWMDALQYSRKGTVGEIIRRSHDDADADDADADDAVVVPSSFAWSVLLATYSPSFLRRQGWKKLETWIHHICQSNDRQGLLALLEQAEVTDEHDPWHVRSMAQRLDRTISGHLCVGGLDVMAPPNETRQLCQLLGWNDEPTIIENCGHAVGMEAPRKWRDDVLNFLNY